MAVSTHTLLWGFIKFQDAYDHARQKNVCDMIKWPLDYFLKCWIPSQQTLYVQIPANAAFIVVMAAADGIETNDYLTWAMTQINYLLGDNKYGISYEISFGAKYPQHPHHRGSSCPTTTTQCNIGDPGPNPNLLKGALVGGPDNQDNYDDRRGDYVKNEVACDYNARFQGALAVVGVAGVTAMLSELSSSKKPTSRNGNSINSIVITL